MTKTLSCLFRRTGCMTCLLSHERENHRKQVIVQEYRAVCIGSTLTQSTTLRISMTLMPDILHILFTENKHIYFNVFLLVRIFKHAFILRRFRLYVIGIKISIGTKTRQNIGNILFCCYILTINYDLYEHNSLSKCFVEVSNCTCVRPRV